MKKLLLLSLFAVLMLFGCSQEQKSSDENKTVTPVPEVLKMPSFQIAAPSDSEIIPVGKEGKTSVELVLSTANLLIRPAGSASKTGEGHFHVIVDDSPFVKVFNKRYTISDLGVGEHTITVELMNNDHSSYSPKIVRSITFSVEKEETPPKLYEVQIKDFSYSPETIEISKGDIVAWKNTGKFPRTATDKGVFDSGVIAPNQVYSKQFIEPGEYDYLSSNYPLMKGKVIVSE